jgi:hypothetical protein
MSSLELTPLFAMNMYRYWPGYDEVSGGPAPMPVSRIRVCAASGKLREDGALALPQPDNGMAAQTASAIYRQPASIGSNVNARSINLRWAGAASRAATTKLTTERPTHTRPNSKPACGGIAVLGKTPALGRAGRPRITRQPPIKPADSATRVVLVVRAGRAVGHHGVSIGGDGESGP